MLLPTAAVVLSLSALIEAASVRHLEDGLLLKARQNNNNGGGQLCLNQNAVQTGSQDDGQNPPVAGQTASATDKANFINFCSGQTVTNGLQVKGGSCNGIVMGKIPSTANMISAVFISPKPGQDFTANTDITLSVQVTGLAAGAFTNAQKTYYAAPQDLNGQGKIIGHTHVTVQDLGNSLQPNNPPNPGTFVFFKGINDAGNGNGLLSATITGGLPAGNYRVCSMTSASNHQPVLMPVAQRGAQDDCQKFTVGAGGGNNGGQNNGGQNNGGNNGGANTGSGNTGSGNTGSGNTGNSNTGGGNTATGALGGIAAPAVTKSSDSSRPFTVNGNTFVNESAAKERACAIQKNGCSDAVNKGGAAFTLSDCNAQEVTCNAS